MADPILDDSPVQENESQMRMSESKERLSKYKLFVVKPEQVDELWNSEDPIAFASELILEHLSVLSEERGQDVNKYSDTEKRYEPNQELKWLSDYLVNSLILLKHTLALEDADTVAEALNALWKTLDFLNVTDEIENGGAAVHSRYNVLQEEMQALFQDKKLTKAQVGSIVQYAKTQLFSHLQLYLRCLSSKQARRQKPIKILASVPQVMELSGGLESDQCKEVQDDKDEEYATLDHMNVDSLEERSKEDEK